MVLIMKKRSKSKVQFQSKMLLYIVSIFLLFPIYSYSCAIKGCQGCVVNADTNIETCLTCDSDYSLTQNGLCEYKRCQTLEYMQEYVDNTNQVQQRCVLFCSENEFQNDNTSLCQSSYECTNTYGQPSQINKSKNIKFVLPSNDGNSIYLVYDTFINIVQKQYGSFVKTISFTSGVSSLQVLDNTLYLLGPNNQQILVWNQINTSYTEMSRIQDKSGVIKTTSKVISVNNAQDPVITTFDNNSQTVYFCSVNSNKMATSYFDSLNLVSPLSVITILLEFVVLQQVSDSKIKIISLAFTNQYKLYGKNNSFTCDGISGQIQDGVQIVIGQRVVRYLIFQQTQHLYLYSQNVQGDNGLCIYQNMGSEGVKLVKLYYQNDQEVVPIVFVQLRNNTIIAYQVGMIFQDKLVQIDLTFSLIDYTVLSKADSAYIYCLLSTNTIQIYSLSILLSQTPPLLKTDSTNSFPTLINNPLKFQVISNTQNDTPLVIVISQDAQIIKNPDSATFSLIRDFKDKVFQNEGTINKLLFMEKYQFIVSCSQDGKILVWRAYDPLSPNYLYSLQKQGQVCNNIVEFQDSYIVSLFTNEIAIINVHNYNLIISYPLNPSFFTYIATTKDFIFLFYNQSLALLNQPDSVIFLSQKQQYPDQFTNIKFIFVTQNNIIVIEKLDFTLYSYKYDNQLQIVPQQFSLRYKHTSDIFFLQMFDLSAGRFQVVFTDSFDLVTFLDDQFNIATQIDVKIGKLFLIKMFEERYYFIGIKIYDISDSNQFVTSVIDIQTNIIQKLGSENSAYSYVQIKKQINNNNEEIIILTGYIALSYTSLTLDGLINLNSNENTGMPYGNFSYSPQQYVTQGISNKDNTLIITGYLSGQVRVLASDSKISSFDIIYDQQAMPNTNKIQFIKTSFALEQYFVATNVINCYSIYTNLLLETLRFSSQDLNTSPESVQKIYVSDKIRVLISNVSTQLIVRDFSQSQQTIYSLVLSDQNSPIKKLNGFYLDEQTSEIFLYGDQVIIFTTHLEIKRIISPSDKSLNDFNSCVFTNELLVCRSNSTNVVFYNRKNNYQQISTFQLSTSLPSCQIIADTTYKQIFLYKQIIEAYTYQGQFTALINIVAYPILTFSFYDDHIALMTVAVIYLFKRNTLAYATAFTTSGGSFLGSVYIKNQKLIAYYSDQVKYGQIQLFSLDTYQSAGFIVNAYSQNKIGKVLKIIFDYESLMLNYIDMYGNNQNIIFNNQKTTDNVFSIEEIQRGLQAPPVDYTIDFITNTIYVHNGVRVWQINYNMLTKSNQRLLDRPTNHCFYMTDASTSTDYLLISDYYNNIYRYSNYQVSFYMSLQSDIISMIQLTQANTQRFIVVLKSSLYIFDNISQQNLDGQQFKNIDGIYYKKTLLISQDRLVINTISNQIIEYDCFKYQSVFTYQLDLINDITCTVEVGSVSSQIWQVCFGISSGVIGCYDLKSASIRFSGQITQSNAIVITKLQIYSGYNFVSIDKQGSIVMIDILTLQPQQSQTIESSVYSVPSLKNGTSPKRQIQFMNFDKNYNRYLVNFKGEKKLGIFNLSNNAFMKFITFPDTEYKHIIQSDTILVLASGCQLNVYRVQDLKFISYVRRYNRRDFLTDIQILGSTKILAVFTNRIELLLVKMLQKVVVAIDTYTLDDPKIVRSYIMDTTKIFIYIGVSKDKIFEKRISLDLYENDYLNQSPDSTLNCISTIQYQDYANTQKLFEQVYNSNSLTQNLYISVKLLSYINDIDLFNQSQVKVILRSISPSQNQLLIKSDSFLKAKFDLKMEGFEFQLSNESVSIMTSDDTQNVILQDILIQDQTIANQQEFMFSSKKNIIINQLTIKNVSKQSVQEDDDLESSGTINPLFYFSDCDNVTFENVDIEGVQLLSKYTPFFYSIRVKSITIRNVSIKSSLFYSMFQIFQTDNIIIQDVIFQDCQVPYYGKSYDLTFFSIHLVGNTYILIKNLSFVSNRGIGIIITNKSYQMEHSTVSLADDSILYKGGRIFNNTFNYKSSQSDIQSNLIIIESSIAQIVNIQFIQNQGNIKLNQIDKATFQNCVFTDNIGVSGGAITVQELSKSLSIINSKFINNDVIANGGAIYLFNVQQFTIDSDSILSDNTAEIGGAIRIINSVFSLWQKYTINCQFKDNVANIFGDNVGTFPNTIQILRKQELSSNDQSSEYDVIFQGSLSSINQTPVILSDVQSGGILPFGVKLIDQVGRTISIDQERYKNNKYHISIIQELDTYLIEVINDQYLQLGDQQIIELKGESMIGIKQYDQDQNVFRFQSLTLTSQPLQKIQSVKIQVALNIINYIAQLKMSINFRECRQGEILVLQQYQSDSNSKTNENLISCSKCSVGTYSLQDTQNQYYESVTANSTLMSTQVCKKCPSSAEYCEGNLLNLTSGYWRQNNSTDEILECNQVNVNICNEQSAESRKGCTIGYIGPLCEKCDTLADVWDERFAPSLAQYSCVKCRDDVFQKLFLSFQLFVLFIYLLFSVFFFMGRYVYESRCHYIRLMSMLPFSKSCILDESSYYIKSLINYLQISSFLFQLNGNIFPSLISYLPQAIGQPSSNAVISATCLFRHEDLKAYGEERLLIVLQAALPQITFIFFFILLFIMQKFRIWEVGRYYKYTMINVVFLFFQPDSLAYFTKALSCRQIGSYSYQTINILLKCKDKSYSIFSYYLVIPNLLFWVITPSIILFFLRRDKGQRNEKLKYCTNRYKYGYFYLEFKPKYFFWEFVRIYLKTLIILITTLLNDIGSNLFVLCIIVIFLYIFVVMKLQPFESKSLTRLEIMAYIIIIPNIFFSEIYKRNPMIGLQIAMFILHYGFLTYIFWIIMRLKFSSQYFQSISRMRHLVNMVCCSYFFIYCNLKKTDNRAALKRWRKLYNNIIQIRVSKTNQDLQKLNDIIRNKRLSSPELLKQVTFNINEVNAIQMQESSISTNSIQGLNIKRVQSIDNNPQIELQENLTKVNSFNQSFQGVQFKSFFHKQGISYEQQNINKQIKLQQQDFALSSIVSKEVLSPANKLLTNTINTSQFSMRNSDYYESDLNENNEYNFVKEALQIKSPTSLPKNKIIETGNLNRL